MKEKGIVNGEWQFIVMCVGLRKWNDLYWAVLGYELSAVSPTQTNRGND